MTRPVPIAGQSIEEMFRITAARNTRNWNLFNVETFFVVGPCVNLEVNLMYNAFKMARVSVDVIV